MRMSDFIITFRLAWCVVVRNWVVYRKDFLANISPTLADPAFMLTALGMGLSPFIGSIHGLSYSQYLAPGMAATTILFTAFFECSYGFYVRMTFESVFKAMLTTPIGTPEVVWGEFIWVAIRASLMAGGVGLVLAALRILPKPVGGVSFSVDWRDPRYPLRRDRTTSLVVRSKHQPISNRLFFYHCADVLPVWHLLSYFGSLDPRSHSPDFAVLPRRTLTPDRGLESVLAANNRLPPRCHAGLWTHPGGLVFRADS